jgi:hypothetical protein
VADLLQAFAAGVFEEANPVAGVLKFVDISPDLGLPTGFVDSCIATASAAGVERHRRALPPGSGFAQLDENTPDFLDLFVGTYNVLVPQYITKAEFLGFDLGLRSGEKGAVLGPDLLGGVARHPESFFVSHRWFRPGSRKLAPAELPQNRFSECNSNAAVEHPESTDGK